MNVGEWTDKWLPKLKHEERMNCDVQRGVNKIKNKKNLKAFCVRPLMYHKGLAFRLTINDKFGQF